MKPHLLKTTVMLLALVAAATWADARPIDAKEISLLLRSKEPETRITAEIQDRKLARKLNADEEKRLRTDGASDMLIRTLRTDNVVLSQSEVAAYDRDVAAATAKRGASGEALDKNVTRNDVRVFNVEFEHPVNLSYWGGPDIDLVFHRQPRIDFGCAPDFHLVEPAGTWTHSTTYLGVRVPGWSGGESFYNSATDHVLMRPMRVDRSNPITMRGLPYMLYPAYAAGDVAVYYVGDASYDSVRLAVIARR